jgi:thioredoxin-related protein
MCLTDLKPPSCDNGALLDGCAPDAMYFAASTQRSSRGVTLVGRDRYEASRHEPTWTGVPCAAAIPGSTSVAVCSSAREPKMKSIVVPRIDSNGINRRKGIFFLARSLLPILLAGVGSVSVAAEPVQTRDALEHFFHQSFNDLREEVETAKSEGKAGIMVMFNDPDCPWCRKMKATIMSQVPVQEYFRKHFRLLHLDTRGDTLMTDFEGNEIAEKDFAFKVHRVRATPVFVFFDLNGKDVLRYTGASRDAVEFMWMAEFVVEEKYKTEKFAQYKRTRLASRDQQK